MRKMCYLQNLDFLLVFGSRQHNVLDVAENGDFDFRYTTIENDVWTWRGSWGCRPFNTPESRKSHRLDTMERQSAFFPFSPYMLKRMYWRS